VHQLSQELELEAKQDKERFANLALKMGDEIHSGYSRPSCLAIVEGDTARAANRHNRCSKQRTVTPGPPLNTDQSWL